MIAVIKAAAREAWTAPIVAASGGCCTIQNQKIRRLAGSSESKKSKEPSSSRYRGPSSKRSTKASTSTLPDIASSRSNSEAKVNKLKEASSKRRQKQLNRPAQSASKKEKFKEAEEKCIDSSGNEKAKDQLEATERLDKDQLDARLGSNAQEIASGNVVTSELVDTLRRDAKEEHKMSWLFNLFRMSNEGNDSAKPAWLQPPSDKPKMSVSGIGAAAVESETKSPVRRKKKSVAKSELESQKVAKRVAKVDTPIPPDVSLSSENLSEVHIGEEHKRSGTIAKSIREGEVTTIKYMELVDEIASDGKESNTKKKLERRKEVAKAKRAKRKAEKKEAQGQKKEDAIEEKPEDGEQPRSKRQTSEQIPQEGNLKMKLESIRTMKSEENNESQSSEAAKSIATPKRGPTFVLQGKIKDTSQDSLVSSPFPLASSEIKENVPGAGIVTRWSSSTEILTAELERSSKAIEEQDKGIIDNELPPEAFTEDVSPPLNPPAATVDVFSQHYKPIYSDESTTRSQDYQHHIDRQDDLQSRLNSQVAWSDDRFQSHEHVAVIIDADQLLIRSRFLKSGKSGAKAFFEHIQKSISRNMNLERPLPANQIRLFLFCNKAGLVGYLSLYTNMCTSRDFRYFEDGLCSIGNFVYIAGAGSEKDSADRKVAAHLLDSIQNRHCKMIYFGGLGDSGYRPLLQTLRQEQKLTKVRLLMLQNNDRYGGVDEFNYLKVNWGEDIFCIGEHLFLQGKLILIKDQDRLLSQQQGREQIPETQIYMYDEYGSRKPSTSDIETDRLIKEMSGTEILNWKLGDPKSVEQYQYERHQKAKNEQWKRIRSKLGPNRR